MRMFTAAAMGGALLGAAAISGAASAAVLFSDNFNGYVNGSSQMQQVGTGLSVLATGDLPGWTHSTGLGSLHAVNRGQGNFAIMFYDTNLMFYATPIAANVAGVTYTVSFDGAIGVYADATQATQRGDYVNFLLNDSTGTIASYNYSPISSTFAPASFTYLGTGHDNGNVFLVIRDGINGNNSFGGAIDNISISNATPAVGPTPVPEPASMALLGIGLVGAASLRRRNKAV